MPGLARERLRANPVPAKHEIAAMMAILYQLLIKLSFFNNFRCAL
jgi:hypothetical protein